MATKVYTAPLAIIQVPDPVNGGMVTIGKARNLRVSETYRRGRVHGVGHINASELPVLEFTGTLNMGYYTIDFNKHPMTRTALLREASGMDVDKFINTLVLSEVGLQITLLRKVASGTATNGVIAATTEEFAVIEQAFITSDGFDVLEGQISGHDSTFEFIDPITRQL